MKSNVRIWLWTVLFILLDQGIKVMINARALQDVRPVLPPLIYFSPMFNRDYSWVNSMLQLGIGKWVHIAIVVLITVLIWLFYKFLGTRVTATGWIDAAFAFLLAGALCSLIDKIVWNGSLDYILLNGFFTFDLKDVYINVFIGLLVLMLIFDHQKIRTGQADKDILADFARYWLGRWRS